MKNIKQLVNAQCAFQGKKFSVLTGQIQSKRGFSPREVVVHPGAVVLLPLYDEETVLMIRNERFAVDEVLWELPAGTLEEGELPEHTAERELIEETGYKAKQLELMLSFYTTPGFCDEIMYSYLAQDLTYVGQNLDDGEKIEVVPIQWSKIQEMIGKRMIKDGKTLTTLLWYQSYYL